MPSASDHEQQAARNEKFYKDTLGGADTQFPDWAMTVLFYTAVHDVQAFLQRKRADLRARGVPRLPRRHHDRQALLHNFWPTLELCYTNLKDWSEDARYDCGKFSKAQLQLAERELRNLRNEIKRLS